jgi:hypothetical protein
MPTRSIVIVATFLVATVAACSSSSSTADESTRNSDGEVIDSGDVGVFALQVGDCIDASAFLDTVSDGDETEVDAFAALPCTEPHTGEVVYVDDQFFADLDEFPTSDELYEQGTTACTEALDEYTGTVYESSSFDFAPLIPTEESWDKIDDRGLVCVGVTLNEAQDATIETTESMRA